MPKQISMPVFGTGRQQCELLGEGRGNDQWIGLIGPDDNSEVLDAILTPRFRSGPASSAALWKSC